MALGKEIENPRAGLRIEIARGFVGEQHARSVDQRTRDRHALTLAAREFGRAVEQSMPKPAGFEEFGGAIAKRGFLGKPAPTRESHERGQHRVLEDVQLWQQVVELEDETHVLAPVARQRRFVGAVQPVVGKPDLT